MDHVHEGSPWTWGPRFVVSPQTADVIWQENYAIWGVTSTDILQTTVATYFDNFSV